MCGLKTLVVLLLVVQTITAVMLFDSLYLDQGMDDGAGTCEADVDVYTRATDGRLRGRLTGAYMAATLYYRAEMAAGGA